MYTEQIKDLERISKAAGKSPDFVQGGGGNTSVKLDDELMAVKASGYMLKDISPTDGYVVVNYKKIKEYHESVDFSKDIDYEKESGEFVRKNIVPMEGLKQLRPSVEAGFHSALLKHVIHTHPVYSNIICCSENGFELSQEIFKDEGYGFIWIPYINPGFMLTIAIIKEVSKYISDNGKFPQVILMENHGLVVTANTATECIKLHEEVLMKIRDYFNISNPYPEVSIEELENGDFISNTQYLTDYFKGKDLQASFFDDTVLYPDQMVYLGGNISVNGSDNKMNINTETGEIIYKTNEKEALTMEETLLGFIYVVENIERNNLKIKTMSSNETDFIKNWESEKYRKSLLK
jgi:ribulose-5-phosphate 4-epimerase/fuculose-1-phosphate aldolase